jgi:NosR/NirI family nitrous oxide reductase transcriptional regulator
LRIDRNSISRHDTGQIKDMTTLKGIMRLLAAAAVPVALGLSAPTQASDHLPKFLAGVEPSALHPEADRFGSIAGEPGAAPLRRGDETIGWVYLNSDVANATGYSGKPIHILVGLDLDGRITGAKLVKHSEPIVLVGIPERKIADFIDDYVGSSAIDYVSGEAMDALPADIVSGATVTIMVIDDSIKRSAVRMARALGLGGLQPDSKPRRAEKVVDIDAAGDVRGWQDLLGDGSVRRLRLTVSDINQAFEAAGNEKAIARPEKGAPEDEFIDLYVALATIPTVGRSLLGDAEYKNMQDRLAPGQHALLIGGAGRYSFKGSGYVRGGIFDRFHLIQTNTSVRFRDRSHKRIGGLAAAAAPRLKEIGLFLIPTDSGFDAAAPWRLQLLVQRQIGALERAFVTFDAAYTPPPKYLKAATPVVEAMAPATEGITETASETPLWQRIWQSRIVDMTVLAVALGVLTLIFFFQDWLVRRPKLSQRIRIGYLTFTVLWLGFYAHAQLSVVNVLTFMNALLTDFRWDYFLTDPLTFMLWFAVAASLLFWGRGPFCGWLCPFGALQELLNKIAKLVRIPQVTVPWGLHERLWPLKYIIFLGLFGLSLAELTMAERLAEVEPFKTAFVLNFVREWPFVTYAVALLAAGLFIERFFCRYLCPLGAALGIPGRMRTFEWLRRYRECGNPCQRCAKDCMVQAIHPDGRINPNECLYCLHCQELYYDDHACPVMIQKRLKLERRLARQSSSMSSRKSIVAAANIDAGQGAAGPNP